MNELKSWDELSPLEQASCEFSDFYKEAHGFRPRHIDTSGWTLADFDREFEVLARVCKEDAVMQDAQEAEAVVRFEARIVDLIACGAKDRSMAIRWIDEAEEAGSNMEYLCFLVGVPYGYFKD
tara:strand:+ start:249 stop:617 length:369 start_codon:yes stop_codon:yes gene_type:complete